MPIPEDLRQQIEELMNAEDDAMIRRTVLGSMARIVSEDKLEHKQIPSWAELCYLKSTLEPILNRATPGNDRSARDVTPWHFMPVVLDAITRMELTRMQAVKEATRALELNSSLKKGKNKATEDETLLLSEDKKRNLRTISSPKFSSMLRERYMLLSLQIRRTHIYEQLRSRAPDIDTLIQNYFPRDLASSNAHLCIYVMKTATPEEIKGYSTTRHLIYDLYRGIDVWEEALEKSGVSEDAMNGQDPGATFSYSKEFERKFPPTFEWIGVVQMAIGWAKTVQKAVTMLEEVFDIPGDSDSIA
ncbi:hypothetical protein BDV93DRAFT_519245 [Ceratobasidium sp. AG-I]|nr:hypothetical protein BDV93DRAFT_519245 [Ceratobasidium sp. AG-I]